MAPSAPPGAPADDAPSTEPSEAEVSDTAMAAIVFGTFLTEFGQSLKRFPPEHRASMARALQRTMFPEKGPHRARDVLLLCIDAIVVEQTVGTNLGPLFRRHFPELGSARDRAVLADRTSLAYRVFAKDWVRWLYAGAHTDLFRHLSVPFFAIIGDMASEGEAVTPASTPRPPGEPWSPSAEQAAFAIAAALHVSHPKVGERALSSLPLVQAAAEHWKPRLAGRWTSVATLSEALGLEAGAESIRQQWADHEAARKQPMSIVTVDLDPL